MVELEAQKKQRQVNPYMIRWSSAASVLIVKKGQNDFIRIYVIASGDMYCIPFYAIKVSCNAHLTEL